MKAIYLSGLLCLLQVTPARAAQLAWPCFTGGSPCRANCFTRGGLLPHLFTLTLAGGLFSAALSVKQVYGPVSPVFQPARCPMKFGSSSGNWVSGGFLAIIYFTIFREHNYYIKPNRARTPGKYFWGNFNFLFDDEYKEVRERSDSRYSRKRKIKIYQKDLDSKKCKFSNFLFTK